MMYDARNDAYMCIQPRHRACSLQPDDREPAPARSGASYHASSQPASRCACALCAERRPTAV